MIYVDVLVSSLALHLANTNIDTLLSVDDVMTYMSNDNDMIERYEIEDDRCRIFCNPDEDISALDIAERFFEFYSRRSTELGKITQRRRDIKKEVDAYLDARQNTSDFQNAVDRFLNRMHRASIISSQSSTVSVYDRLLFVRIDYLLPLLDYSTSVQLLAVLDHLAEHQDLTWEWGSDSNNHILLVLKFRPELLKMWFPD